MTLTEKVDVLELLIELNEKNMKKFDKHLTIIEKAFRKVTNKEDV